MNHVGTLGRGTADNYKLVDIGISKLDDKYLYYKISRSDESYSIMYYFMKNDYSDILYEIKSICDSEKYIEMVQDFLENIALTVEFMKYPIKYPCNKPFIETKNGTLIPYGNEWLIRF